MTERGRLREKERKEAHRERRAKRKKEEKIIKWSECEKVRCQVRKKQGKKME